MNKILMLLFLLFSHYAQSQYITFRINLIKGKLNNKEIIFPANSIQMDIKDSSDINTYGYNNDNERLGVQFLAVKVVTADGTYYLPSVECSFVEKSGNIVYHSHQKLNYEQVLTKTNPVIGLTKISTSSDPGDVNSFEITFSYFIDGKKLNYDETIPPVKNPRAKMELDFKSLKINNTNILKKKLVRLNLKESTDTQTISIGAYMHKPVLLRYKITTEKVPKDPNIAFYSTIIYTDSMGSKTSYDFIKANSKSGKNTRIDVGIYSDDMHFKTSIKSDYDCIFNKK